GCATCRLELVELEAVRDVLDDVPPEALLHGPPDADLVLQRTLRRVRAERVAGVRQQRSLVVAAALGVLAGAVGGRVAIGRGTSGPAIQSAPQPPAATTPAAVPGARVGSTVNPKTNVRLTASLIPAAGWVRVNASVHGIAAGENCRLLVVGRDGKREIA